MHYEFYSRMCFQYTENPKTSPSLDMILVFSEMGSLGLLFSSKREFSSFSLFSEKGSSNFSPILEGVEVENPKFLYFSGRRSSISSILTLKLIKKISK